VVGLTRLAFVGKYGTSPSWLRLCELFNMPSSLCRSPRRLVAPPVASWSDQLNNYALDRGTAHLNTVNEGKVHRLTTGQQLVGAAALYYSAGRLLFDMVELLAPRRKRRTASSK
jgi:hypothetical protein